MDKNKYDSTNHSEILDDKLSSEHDLTKSYESTKNKIAKLSESVNELRKRMLIYYIDQLKTEKRWYTLFSVVIITALMILGFHVMVNTFLTIMRSTTDFVWVVTIQEIIESYTLIYNDVSTDFDMYRFAISIIGPFACTGALFPVIRKASRHMLKDFEIVIKRDRDTVNKLSEELIKNELKK